MFSQKAEIAMLKRDIRKTEIARSIGLSKQATYNRFSTDNWREKDMVEICHLLNAHLEIHIVFDDTGEKI